MTTHSQELPEVAIPGEAALVASAHIFDIRNKPTKESHASTIVQTPAGLVAAWFAGTREHDLDVGIRIARWVDGRWSESVEVASGIQSPELRYPSWNPVLFQPSTGSLMLFYKVGLHPTSWWGMLMTSDDGGETWSPPTRLGEDESIGHLLGPVKNKPIQLDDGTIVCPSSTEVNRADGTVLWRVHFERTSDLGKTWQVIGPIDVDGNFNAIQPSLLTYADGRMQILCRSREKRIVQSWSHDGGRSWTPLTATPLPNPNSGTDAVTLDDGRQLLVYNHMDGNVGDRRPRSMLNIAVSPDGTSWTTVMTLEKEALPMPIDKFERRNWGEYSYPAVIQTADGMIHITYTYNREGVKHAIVDPRKL